MPSASVCRETSRSALDSCQPDTSCVHRLYSETESTNCVESLTMC